MDGYMPFNDEELEREVEKHLPAWMIKLKKIMREAEAKRVP